MHNHTKSRNSKDQFFYKGVCYVPSPSLLLKSYQNGGQTVQHCHKDKF